ncbi:MAG: helix-hairpin-helix domain-containing protein [Anaerococcus vaginalis]|nr:helix-hairpin-helix domain-containing protein [Anaerococcus vaginalis]
METDRKDKLIIALIIGIVIVLAHNFINSQKKDELVFENASSSIAEKNENSKAVNSSNIDKKSESKTSSKKVHISGEINKPGVYEIKNDYRLEDLVNDAGGLTKNADINKINLALKLEDQMRIIIPNINDKDNEKNNVANQQISPINENNNKKININTADKAQLMNLPNIGEKRAEAIIEYREKNRFNKIDDIKNVSGIGDKYFEAMKDIIVVD